MPKGKEPNQPGLEHFQKYCSHSGEIRTKRSFWLLASFRLSRRVFQTCSFAEASPKTKNPRSEWLHYFFKRSKHFSPHEFRPLGPSPSCPSHQRNLLNGNASRAKSCSVVVGGGFMTEGRFPNLFFESLMTD